MSTRDCQSRLGALGRRLKDTNPPSVRQTGGHIRIYSELGVGTTVKIYLPRAMDDLPSASAETGPPSVSAQGGGETILLVEDHDDLRSFSTGVLAELGYRVLAATNGAEALWILDAGHCVNLLFTDVVLPGGLDERRLGRRQPRGVLAE